ncbi:response regulator [Coralliovum pocilloporae]|uniref:response regulator n=1 Tax=Coralliovum pocilloporae TaxID=3066369 RepID=UPI003306BB9C
MIKHAAYGHAPSELDVVMIDSSKQMQTLMRSMLSSAGVRRIRVFDNADVALEAMLSEPPTVILSDWYMKPTSGYQLLKAIRLKQMEPLCFVPAIVISDRVTRPMIEKALRAGAHHCLVKPLSSSTLHRCLTWLANDDREFMLEGSSYVIGGVQDLLAQQRLRQEGLVNARKYYQTLTQSGSAVQNTVDEILHRKEEEERPVVNAATIYKPRFAAVSRQRRSGS